MRCRVEKDGRAVSAEMGRVSFDSRMIPVTGPPREVLNEPIEVGGEKLLFSAATIGNPHCVVLREHVNEAEARRLGPLLETDSRFPNRTNVQLVKVEDRKRLRVEIWERGAGYTLSSGTSSCAAAAVVLRLGRCDRDVAVYVPGGVLRVCFDEQFGARLSGPVTRIADGNLSEEMLGA